jgi:uncharacterized membrane protein
LDSHVSDLLVVVYDGEHRAAEALNSARRDEQQLSDLEDAAYVTRDAEGVARLHQGSRLTPRGPITSPWTSLVRLFFVSPEAEFRALQLGDYGIEDEFARRVNLKVGPGSSALFVLRSDEAKTAVESAIAGLGSTVMHTALDDDAATHLRRSLQGALDGCLSA